jgi:hypothetical protein
MMGSSQQTVAGYAADIAGKASRDTAAHNLDDMFEVAKRAHVVANEIDHSRKLLERFILGTDVKTYTPPFRIPPVVYPKADIKEVLPPRSSTFKPDHVPEIPPLVEATIPSAFLIIRASQHRRSKHALTIRNFI